MDATQQPGEAPALATSSATTSNFNEHVSHLSPLGQQAALATDYWHTVRQAYPDTPEVIDALFSYCEDYARGRLDEQKLRENVAALLCDRSDLARSFFRTYLGD